MAERILLWKGFSTLVFWKKIDGEGAHITVETTIPEARTTPEEAWEDARRFEDEHERYVKKEDIKRDTVKIFTGICPAQYATF